MFPVTALRMIRAGESSGQLTTALENAAAFCEREVNDATEALLATLEPALTLLMGLILALVVLAVLWPVYSNLSTLNIGN